MWCFDVNVWGTRFHLAPPADGDVLKPRISSRPQLQPEAPETNGRGYAVLRRSRWLWGWVLTYFLSLINPSGQSRRVWMDAQGNVGESCVVGKLVRQRAASGLRAKPGQVKRRRWPGDHRGALHYSYACAHARARARDTSSTTAFFNECQSMSSQEHG